MENARPQRVLDFMAGCIIANEMTIVVLLIDDMS